MFYDSLKFKLVFLVIFNDNNDHNNRLKTYTDKNNNNVNYTLTKIAFNRKINRIIIHVNFYFSLLLI